MVRSSGQWCSWKNYFTTRKKHNEHFLFFVALSPRANRRVLRYGTRHQTMSEAVPPVDRILAAAETVLRRHGVDKTNVVDIARALDISHTNIYRHFPSKKALLDAVAARWLEAVTAPLKLIANDRARPATARLTAWFDALRAAKQHKVLDDPELFRVYHRLAMAARELASTHITGLIDQVARIIADGMASGEFSEHLDPRAASRACLHAMSPFHHPAMLSQGPPPTEADARAVFGLLLAGLRAGGEEVLDRPLARARDHQRDLALGRVGAVVFQQPGGRSPSKLLELLGQLPRDADLPLRRVAREHLQGAFQPVG